MGRIVVEAWLGGVGFLRRQRRDGTGGKCGADQDVVLATTVAPRTVGVLALEVAGLISRVAHLWHSIADDQVARLRDDVLLLEGVRKLVSDHREFLLALALSEMLDALGGAARAAAVLSRRCSVPSLQRFEHVLPEIVSATVAGGEGVASDYALAGLHCWAFTEKKMVRKVRKMERLAATTVHLYQEMEVLAEMEHSLRRAQANTTSSGFSGFFQGVSLMDLRHKVAWQRQEVKALRDQSLWNRSYDYVVRLLARSLFSIVLRINLVFGFQWRASNVVERGDGGPRASGLLPRSRSVAERTTTRSSFRLANNVANTAADVRFCSGPLERSRIESLSVATGSNSGPICGTMGIVDGQRPAQKGQLPPPLPGCRRHSFTKTRWSVFGGPFRGCMVAGSESPVLRSCVPQQNSGGFTKSSTAPSLNPNSTHDARLCRTQTGSDILGAHVSLSLFYSKRKLLCALPSTLGASALALHYANIIIVIEKLATSPHLIGPEARDDLYGMLPASIRAALRTRLKPYAKNFALCLCDPVLAAEWSDAVTRILEWLAPLAHNMIRWQSERNYEQQHWVCRSNVLLLQTLYFANQAKTEAAVLELLVGLNYLWRFAREINNKAIQTCLSN